ncbi:hypothetical protein GALMADRAFT_226664 [Galerina marginata CBS 339.88]|uniref:Uncharacterized protein n=1 Tax=Galerina marginata (strain CBS 339.88) TaxID=685588 RepID=A0A067SVW9_GALM3|nr:hypothetical protein GALMADRAFT_226664 [Galerina marginata CBS 339.88]
MQSLRKLGTKVFTKNENAPPTRTPNKPRDKTLRHSRSMPLGPATLTSPETYVRSNKPVYKGPIPLKEAKIELVMNISRDPTTASTNFTPYDSDDEQQASFAAPRAAPTFQPKVKARPPPKPVTKPAKPAPSVPKPVPKVLKPVPKPIPKYVPKPALDSDSESEYSNGNGENNNDVPPTPPPKPSPKPKPTTNELLKKFPAPPNGRRPLLLREVLKPVHPLDLPIEMQKDLLPPHPITFDARYRAIKAREKEKKSDGQEKGQQEDNSRKPLQQSLSSNQSTQTTPTRTYPKASQQVWPSAAVFNNGSHSSSASGSQTTRVYHAPSPSNISNLSLDPNAHLRDGPAARRVVVNNGLPSSVRLNQARPPLRSNMDYASMSTGYMGPSPFTRPLNVHSRKISNSSVMDSTGSVEQSTRANDLYNRSRLASNMGHGHSHSTSEFGHLPSHPAVYKSRHGPSASESYGNEPRSRRT